ncbi:MAG: ABC transporter ATP-binding protein [Nitrospiraceae bacterium]|nr:ABC transporter ATP-binding protein [Nitrospiraceae bacterium]
MSSASDTGILELSGIRFSYSGGSAFVDNLGFRIGEGEFIGLLGANGSGKSTILKIAAGILTPSAGEVSLWNKPLHAYNNKDRAKLLCYLPQSLDMTIPFTVSELVGMGLYPYDIAPEMSVDDALDLVGLRDKAQSRISDLSGGERRRAFVAMTLIQGAGIFLLDEPLANLDIRYQIELVKLLRDLRTARKITVVMALHDINIALQFEKVILIKKGTIIGQGRPEDILTEENISEAFGVQVKIMRHPDGKAYISYAENFS